MQKLSHFEGMRADLAGQAMANFSTAYATLAKADQGAERDAKELATPAERVAPPVL